MAKVFGNILVITGPMFSGKTTRMIRFLNRAYKNGEKVLVVKPWIDTRPDTNIIHAHNGKSFPAVVVKRTCEILCLLERDITLLGIDEAQFFDSRIVEVCQEAEKLGINVVVNGLDLDFRGKPFGPMPQILSIASKVIKLTANCEVCGRPAEFTQRLIDGKLAENDAPIILIGGKESYQPRCKTHFVCSKK